MPNKKDTHIRTDYTEKGGIGSQTTFGVGLLPGRKQYALYTCSNGVVKPIAWFSCKENAIWFKNTLNIWGDPSNKFRIS